MEFKQLQYMLRIAREQSFSKAAEKLYVSQPSLSQHISKLEQQLGIELFDRKSIPLKLTYAGELYAKAAEKILDIKDQTDKQIQDINNFKIGRLVVGISFIRGTYMLPKLLPVFHKSFPGIEINIIEGTSPELECALLEGTVDIAILGNHPMHSKDLQFEVIQNEEILVSVCSSHPLTKQFPATPVRPYPSIPIACIQDENFILLTSGQTMREISNTIFEREGFKPRIFLEAKSYETALALTEVGLGITFSIATMLRPGIAYFSIGDPPLTKPLVVAYSKKRYLSKAAYEFINITKEVWGFCRNTHMPLK